MTPYATLLVRPQDTDDTIRFAFQQFAKTEHPDRNDGVPGALWAVTLAAYNEVKTAERRAKLAKRMESMAGLCWRCSGAGVVGTRAARGRITVCSLCQGEGRK